MDYQDYIGLKNRVAQLMASNKYKEAEDELYPLLLSDISELDKAEVCVKLAKIHDRTGGADEALSWFDRGIGYEQAYCRYAVTKEKARYITELGHCVEAVSIYEGLLKQLYVTEAEKEDIRKEIKAVLSKAIGQWK